jgi:hypothetical protein
VEWRKFDNYDLEVDPYQDDKAKEIQLCSFQRPHMRAFHCAWYVRVQILKWDATELAGNRKRYMEMFDE